MRNGAWFWFREQRTGLVYLDQPAADRAHLLRLDRPGSSSWVTQLIRRGTRAVCYDADPIGDGRFRLVLPGQEEEWRLDPDLTAQPGEQVGTLAIAPADWDAITVAWLVAGAEEPLCVWCRSRGALRDQSVVTLDDVGVPALELRDAAISFTSGDRLGPAVRPSLIAAESRVLVTFPQHARPHSPFEIELRLLDILNERVPVQIFQVHKKWRLHLIAVRELTPSATSIVVPLGKLPEQTDIYIQTPGNVHLCYCDGREQSRVTQLSDGRLARRFMFQGLSAPDPRLIDRHAAALDEYRQAMEARATQVTDEAPRLGGSRQRSVRSELCEQYGIADLRGQPAANATFGEFPAPLLAALFERVAAAPGDEVEVACRFMNWPAAAQLDQCLAASAAPTQRPPNAPDATTAAWRQAGATTDDIGWLAAESKRQLALLPLIAECGDAGRLLAVLRRLPDPKNGELAASVDALRMLDRPTWARLDRLSCPGGELHERGKRLLEELCEPPESHKELASRGDRLRRLERDARRHVAELADARRSCGPYADEVAAVAHAFEQSADEGLAEIERLTSNYRAENDDGSDEPAVRDLVREFEENFPPEFLFDCRALQAIARKRWHDALTLASVVQWLEQLAMVLDGRVALTEVPSWSESRCSGDLEDRVSRIRQTFVSLLCQRAVTAAVELPAPLREEARRLTDNLDAELARSRGALATLDTDEFALGELHDEVERGNDTIIRRCLANTLRVRQDALLTRASAIAPADQETTDALIREARQVNSDQRRLETLGPWSNSLARLESALAKFEERFAKQRLILERAGGWLGAPLGRPLTPAEVFALWPELVTKLQGRIAALRDECRSADEQTARAAALTEAMHGQSAVPLAARADEPPAASDGADRLEAVFAWESWHQQRIIARNSALAELGATARDVLARRCPNVLWDDDCGSRIAEALVAIVDRDPSDAVRAFTTAADLLDDAWRLTGGNDKRHVRDVVWLGRESALIRRVEAVLAAAKQPARLVTERGLEESKVRLNNQSPDHMKSFPQFRAHLGKLAAGRLDNLLRDAEARRALAACALEPIQASTWWHAISEVARLVRFAQDDENAGSASEALRAAMGRHGLWPTPLTGAQPSRMD
jgi:hypothetical protein